MAALVIGSMDPSLSVSRTEILNWLNTFLDLSYAKIEDTANGTCSFLASLTTSIEILKISGAAACQLTCALHPGSLDLSKVQFNPLYKSDWENNYMLLEGAFRKLGIVKVGVHFLVLSSRTQTIPVKDLMRGKYRDNLEFCQWLYRWVDRIEFFILNNSYWRLNWSTEVSYSGKAQRKAKNCIYEGDNAPAAVMPPPSSRKPRQSRGTLISKSS